MLGDAGQWPAVPMLQYQGDTLSRRQLIERRGDAQRLFLAP